MSFNKNKIENKAKIVKAHSAINETRAPICSFCNKEHTIYNYKDFLALSISSRISKAKRLNMCLNCLRKNHTTDRCKSATCRKCQGRHNSLLHVESQNKTNTDDPANNKDLTNNINVKHNNNDTSSNVSCVQ